jgi:hypothetical protein
VERAREAGCSYGLGWHDWTVAGLAAFVVAVVALNAALLGDAGQPAAVPAVLGNLVRFPGPLAGGTAVLVGMMLTTGEYRHRTTLTTRLVQPSASKLVLSKVVAAALAGLALAFAIEVAVLAGGAAVLASRDVAVEPLQHGIPVAGGCHRGCRRVACGCRSRNR